LLFLDGRQLFAAATTFAALSSDLLREDGKGVLGKLNVRVESVVAFVVGAVLPLGLTRAERKHVTLPDGLFRIMVVHFYS